MFQREKKSNSNKVLIDDEYEPISRQILTDVNLTVKPSTVYKLITD